MSCPLNCNLGKQGIITEGEVSVLSCTNSFKSAAFYTKILFLFTKQAISTRRSTVLRAFSFCKSSLKIHLYATIWNQLRMQKYLWCRPTEIITTVKRGQNLFLQADCQLVKLVQIFVSWRHGWLQHLKTKTFIVGTTTKNNFTFDCFKSFKSFS